MARIENAIIDVAGIARDRVNVRVTISCSFRWTSGELTRRDNYNLEIYFWSKDVREKKLRVELFVPEILDNPVIPESDRQLFTRAFDIPSSKLNEDDGPFNKKDEIFARLRLLKVGVTTGAATAKTATFKGYF